MLFGLFARKNIKTLTDADLVTSVKEGTKSAEGELFIRYSSLVMGLCLKYLRNVEYAEDTMMILFEKLPDKVRKSEIKNFKNWLYSVAKNECLMELRSRKIPTTNLESSINYLEDDSDDKLEIALQNDKKLKQVESAIEQLKSSQKICIELFYIKGKSYDQICTETGFDLNKVKSNIQNAKRNLKITLEQNQL